MLLFLTPVTLVALTKLTLCFGVLAVIEIGYRFRDEDGQGRLCIGRVHILEHKVKFLEHLPFGEFLTQVVDVELDLVIGFIFVRLKAFHDCLPSCF